MRAHEILGNWFSQLPEEAAVAIAAIRVAYATPTEGMRTLETVRPLYQPGIPSSAMANEGEPVSQVGGYVDWRATARSIVGMVQDHDRRALKLRVWVLRVDGESITSKTIDLQADPNDRPPGTGLEGWNVERVVSDQAQAMISLVAEVRGAMNQLVVANEHLVNGQVLLMEKLYDTKLEVAEQEAATLMLGAELESMDDPVKMQALAMFTKLLEAKLGIGDPEAIKRLVLSATPEQIDAWIEDPQVRAKIKPRLLDMLDREDG